MQGEERDRKRLTEVLATLVGELSPVVPAKAETVSPVVQSGAGGREAEEVPNVVPDKRGGKDLTVDSLHCRNKGDVKVVAW